MGSEEQWAENFCDGTRFGTVEVLVTLDGALVGTDSGTVNGR